MTLELRASRLRRIIDTTIASMRPACEAKCLRVSFDMLGADKEVIADPQRMQQIVTNLLTNAIKFTDPGGWIKLDLDERSRSSVELRVTETPESALTRNCIAIYLILFIRAILHGKKVDWGRFGHS